MLKQNKNKKRETLIAAQGKKITYQRMAIRQKMTDFSTVIMEAKI